MKLKFSIHPLMLVLIIVAAFYGYFFMIASYLLVVFLHELAHALTAKKFGYKLNSITLMPYGAGISGQVQGMMNSHEIIVALAGPLLNVILGVATVALWWAFPSIYVYTEYFALANWVTALINLFPVFPLDGGRVALSLLCTKVSRKKGLTILKITGYSLSSILIVIFTLSAFFAVNYTFLCLGIFLFLSTAFDTPNSFYTRNLYSIKKLKMLRRGLRVNQVAVIADTEIMYLLKYVNNHSITEFKVYSDKHKLLGTLSEFQLHKVAQQVSPDTRLLSLFVKS